MTTTHGPFEETSWIPKSGAPTARVKFGDVECRASNDSMMAARMKAWREMALKLAETLEKAKGPTLVVVNEKASAELAKMIAANSGSLASIPSHPIDAPPSYWYTVPENIKEIP